MQRFFFHLYNGVDSLDEAGKSLPSLAAARAHAVELARFEVSEATKREGRIVLSHRIDVADASGAVLATVQFGDAVQVTP